MPRKRNPSQLVEAFDRRYRPGHLPDMGPHGAPSLFSSSRRDHSRAQWVERPALRVDALYARRAALLHRLADGDESARPEYERTLAALRSLQEREAEMLHDRMSREAQQHRQNLQLLDDAERFLQQHAHLVPSP